MSRHLCLKWNNHSSAFLKILTKIKSKESFCDATIECQGRNFPVHRIILSMCSEYFEEIFDRIKCQHPYIIFKDLEPKEMELLLDYMYQGEVNVIQENLPGLIKAAESLRIRGLAVPDDMSTESSGKKRNSSSLETCNNTYLKKRTEDISKKRQTSNLNLSKTNSASIEDESSHITEQTYVKEEPVDLDPLDDHITDSKSQNESVTEFESYSFPNTCSTFPKTEDDDLPPNEFPEEPPPWTSYPGNEHPLPSTEITGQTDMSLNVGGTVFGLQSCDGTNQHKVNRVSVHKCPFCGYEGSRRGHLQNHIMSKHTGEKPYLCTICARRFVEKSTLKCHQRIHTGERPFACSICQKRFRHTVSLKLHWRRVHGSSELSSHLNILNARDANSLV